ncbi:MAG: glycosyltransferase family 2 protein [bacterium]|nr:glycosyltransferase family 2 protein [bacterium]
MKNTVVIPNWNGRSLLEKNLPSVLGVGFDEVIVVDDASTDDSVDFLKKNFPEIKLIENPTNRGFSYTVNTGVENASGEIVYLFNTDMVPKENVLEPVLKHFEDKDVFGVSLSEEGYSWAKPKKEFGFLGHEPGERTETAHETFWISGGSGAFRKSMWDKLGGMDLLFSPFYWEDLDLSYRALRTGWKLIWEPRAMVVHKHESTINPKNFSKKYLDYIKERNQLIFHWKNLPLGWLLTVHLLGLLKRLLNPGYLVVILMAIVKLPQIIIKRLTTKYPLSHKQVMEKF